MSENPTFSPERALGDGLSALKRGELIELAIKLCEAIGPGDAGAFRGGIRPTNVCFEDGEVILGPAAAMGSTGWTKDELEYLAPELFWNGKGSPRSDVYAVGLMLYAGCNGGRLPFVPADPDPSPDDRANALKTRMNGQKIEAPWGAGKKLKAIIEKATAFKEMERYFDAPELGAALSEYLEAVPVDAGRTASEVFGKAVDELSPVERIMVDIIHSSLIDDDIEKPAPVEEEVVLIEEAAPAEEAAPVEEVPPVEEPAPTEEPAPVEEPAPTEEAATTYEPTPTEEASPEKTPAPKKEPIIIEVPVYEKPVQQDKKQPKPQAKKPARSDASKPAVQYTMPKQDAAKKKPVQKKKAKKKQQVGGAKSVLIVLAVLVLIGGGLYLFRDKLPFISGSPAASVTPTPDASVQPSTQPSESVTPTVQPSSEPVAHSYEIIVGDLSWDEAELACIEKGGHLVTINSQDEYDTVCAMLRDYNVKYVWIGCYRDPAGLMTWTSGQDVDLYFWQSGEPSMTDSYDGAEENYIMMVRQPDDSWLYNDSRMNPLEKYRKYYTGKIAYICEYGD